MKNFVAQLMSLVKIAQLKPNETHVLEVQASFGSYQVLLGPLPNSGTDHGCLPIEINGELHHLVVSQQGVAAHPSREQIRNHLKGCVILKNMRLHFKDSSGSGDSLEKKEGQQMLFIRENINMAGPEGVKHLDEVTKNGALAEEAYRIIQQDILKALSKT